MICIDSTDEKNVEGGGEGKEEERIDIKGEIMRKYGMKMYDEGITEDELVKKYGRKL